MSTPLQKPYTVIDVIEISTGETIKIKDFGFNPELHQIVGMEKTPSKPPEEEKEDCLCDLKMQELRKLAQEKGIKVNFGVKKKDLIDLLT